MDQRERPIIKFTPGDNIIDYMYPYQLEMIEKHFKNPWLLIANVNQALIKRKSITPIKSPFKYLLSFAQDKKWEMY